MRTKTQEAVLPAYIASIGKRTPRHFFVGGSRSSAAPRVTSKSLPYSATPKRLPWRGRFWGTTTPRVNPLLSSGSVAMAFDQFVDERITHYQAPRHARHWYSSSPASGLLRPHRHDRSRKL